MKKYDISYNEAFYLADRNITQIGSEIIPITLAVGRVAAEDIKARVDSPSIDASMKDGFAVISDDVVGASESSSVCLEIVGSVAAGGEIDDVLEKGKTIRVLTGAPLPKGADAVLSDEFAKQDGSIIKAVADAEKGRNILFRGEDVRVGELLAKKGDELNPSIISLLVAGGLFQISVFKKPKVCLLATGDEVLLPGSDLPKGKLFASNIALQQAWFESIGFEASLKLCKDTFTDIEESIKTMIKEYDVIITSGGAWKGDRDLVVNVLDFLGWNLFFHRARMGPGKAVGMGILNDKPIFCLPGGPPSNEMAFLMIAFPCVFKMAGYDRSPYIHLKGILDTEVKGQIDWTQFKHCMVKKDGRDFILSPIKLRSRLASMAKAQGLFIIPEGVETILKGDYIDFICLDKAVVALC
ncbi:MAG: molybdopterin molybdotransferase MoeA [Desulfobacterales bacterium]|nr:molybdopterin molybdotransferase MoeA [Desulfobacterales bacterium]